VAALERLRQHLRGDVTGDGLPAARALADSPSPVLLSYMVHLQGVALASHDAGGEVLSC